MGMVVAIILALLTAYMTLCITVHEIRINYWKGTETKLGTISHLGIVPNEHGFKLYLVVMLAFVVATIGYFIDRQRDQSSTDHAEKVEAVEAIRKGIESFERSEGRPAREALEEQRQKHGISR